MFGFFIIVNRLLCFVLFEVDCYELEVDVFVKENVVELSINFEFKLCKRGCKLVNDREELLNYV